MALSHGCPNPTCRGNQSRGRQSRVARLTCTLVVLKCAQQSLTNALLRSITPALLSRASMTWYINAGQLSRLVRLRATISEALICAALTPVAMMPENRCSVLPKIITRVPTSINRFSTEALNLRLNTATPGHPRLAHLSIVLRRHAHQSRTTPWNRLLAL